MPLTRLRVRLDEIDHKWGPVIQLVLGCAITACCIGLTVLALEIRAQGRETDQRSEDTARQSRIACQRTRRFGPPLAAYYERQHALTPAALAAYRETIPLSCP